MIVKDLKKLLEELPDNAHVVVRGNDHSYYRASCQVTTGLMERINKWTEDYGEEVTPEAEYGKRLPILLVE